jgi:hypothetical protein
MDTALSMEEGNPLESIPGDEGILDLGMTEKARAARQRRMKGIGKVDNAETEQDRIRILRSQRLLTSLRETGEEIKYVEIPSIESKQEIEPSSVAPEPTYEYDPPDTKRMNVEEKRRQLELEKEAFEKMKRHHAELELEIQNQPTYDVDDTIDTTQSSERKFLTFEDVKGIIHESRILSCVSDNQAIEDIDDGDDLVLEEENILAKLKGSLKESLELLRQPKDTMPTEISFSAEAGEQISSQISFLDKQDEELGSHISFLGKQDEEPIADDDEPLKPIREEGNDQAATLNTDDDDDTNKDKLPTNQEEELGQGNDQAATLNTDDDDDTIKDKLPTTQEEELGQGNDQAATLNTDDDDDTIKDKLPTTQEEEFGQLKMLERKVSEVVKLQVQKEELHKKENRKKAEAQKREEEGINYLRQKSQTRQQLEEAAKLNAQQQEAAKWQASQTENEAQTRAAPNRDVNVIQERKSTTLMKLTQPLRRVLTNLYPVAGNEITLEEYEEQASAFSRRLLRITVYYIANSWISCHSLGPPTYI